MVVNLTRERLLNGARTAIRAQGYSETSVDDLARAAGLTKGAVYSQFASKTDLLLSLIDQWASTWIDRIQRSRQPQPGLLADFALADAQNEWGEILPDFWRQAVDDAAVRQQLADAYLRLESALAAAAASAPGQSAQATARSALALHDGFVALASLGLQPRRSERAEVERYLAGPRGQPNGPARRDRTG